MRGYPKHINCKQDFLNLLEMPEHRERAKADLWKLQALDDSKATRVCVRKVQNPDAGEEYTVPGGGMGGEGPITFIRPDTIEEEYTEEIDNPMPLWKQKGFESREAVAALVTKNGGKV